ALFTIHTSSSTDVTLTISMSYADVSCLFSFILFFFNATATAAIYTLSLHDALPIYLAAPAPHHSLGAHPLSCLPKRVRFGKRPRSEEHTSELQSQSNLVCRLLLEKKKIKQTSLTTNASSPHSQHVLNRSHQNCCPHQ